MGTIPVRRITMETNQTRTPNINRTMGHASRGTMHGDQWRKKKKQDKHTHNHIV